MKLGDPGLPPLTQWAVASSWTADWPAIILGVLLGCGYLLAVLRVKRRGTAWPASRVVFFLAGLAIFWFVRLSFLGVYSDILFWPRAVQNIVLLMVVPLLLALGAPLSLTLASSGEQAAHRLRRWGRSAPARMVTFPLIVTGLLVGPLIALYLTPAYELGLRYPLIGQLEQFGLMGCGFVYFWTRLQRDPTPRQDSHLVSMWISMAEVIFDGALGLALALGPLVAQDYYLAVHPAWAPSPRMDQVIGAGVLWIGGDLAGLPFVAAVINQWRRDDSRQAAVIDRELDEQEATAPESAPARLWWEDDPVLSQRFRGR